MADRQPTHRLNRFRRALIKLVRIDSRKAMIVLLRLFVGLSVEETADALDVSSKTVDNEWRFARAWMRRQVKKGRTTAPAEDHDDGERAVRAGATDLRGDAEAEG